MKSLHRLGTTLAKYIVPALAIAITSGCGAPDDAVSGPVSGIELDPGLFSTAAITDALPVGAARNEAEAGSQVTVSGRIAGRTNPFVEGRAVFLLADEKLDSCTETCPAPWDLCCELPEDIAPNLATVQVPGPEGAPIEAGLEGVNGLVPLARVTVEGEVQTRDEEVFIVNARRIHVHPQ